MGNNLIRVEGVRMNFSLSPHFWTVEGLSWWPLLIIGLLWRGNHVCEISAWFWLSYRFCGHFFGTFLAAWYSNRSLRRTRRFSYKRYRRLYVTPLLLPILSGMQGRAVALDCPFNSPCVGRVSEFGDALSQRGHCPWCEYRDSASWIEFGKWSSHFNSFFSY